MKNIQIIDGADNATFSIFQATDEEFAEIFPNGQDMELSEDFHERVGDERARAVLTPIWERPILKRDATAHSTTTGIANEGISQPLSGRWTGTSAPSMKRSGAYSGRPAPPPEAQVFTQPRLISDLRKVRNSPSRSATLFQRQFLRIDYHGWWVTNLHRKLCLRVPKVTASLDEPPHAQSQH